MTTAAWTTLGLLELAILAGTGRAIWRAMRRRDNGRDRRRP